MRHLLPSSDDYISGRMNKWTGRYARTDKPTRSDDLGFLTGRLWLLSLATGNQELRDRAVWMANSTASLVGEAATLVDASWDLYYALALGAEITGSQDFAQKALEACRRNTARSVSKPDPAAAFVFQVGEERLIPFEGSASMQLVGWASAAAPDVLAHHLAHLDHLVELGFIRPDGSSHHLAELDEAYKVIRLKTYQGYSADSTWARGQAWGMMGFTAAYEATGIQRYLDTAVRLTDFWLSRTGDDPVPFYDFDDPRKDEVPRDSCAAAIVANVLMRLHRLRPGDPRYLAAADATITELHNNYLGRGGSLLHGSGGQFTPIMFGSARTRRPPKTPADWALARRFPQEEVMHYGDYFFVEALYRRTHEDWGIFDLPSRQLNRSPAGGQETR